MSFKSFSPNNYTLYPNTGYPNTGGFTLYPNTGGIANYFSHPEQSSAAATGSNPSIWTKAGSQVAGSLASALGSGLINYLLRPDQPKPPPQQMPIQPPAPYQPPPQNDQFGQLTAMLSQLDRGY